ncbi:MAG: hypothetical protein JSU63_01390 [Phycisphaerales bacterium]|nr:MAG: hypothetical protein JSU63_01390 [Phycisphaerales bacterium]
MRSRRTIGEARWPGLAEFVTLAKAWQTDAITQLLGFVWRAYDLLCERVLSQIDCAQADLDLERNITQLLEPLIREVMPGCVPYYVQHAPHEFETALEAPAQPPLPDIGFVMRANPRIMWPLEAKAIRTDKAVSAYVKEIQENFLTCRYAPFSKEGGMLAYLVAGDPSTAFENIAARLASKLEDHPRFPERNHKTSKHQRSVPAGKRYARGFQCHHMIFPLSDSTE